MYLTQILTHTILPNYIIPLFVFRLEKYISMNRSINVLDVTGNYHNDLMGAKVEAEVEANRLIHKLEEDCDSVDAGEVKMHRNSSPLILYITYILGHWLFLFACCNLIFECIYLLDILPPAMFPFCCVLAPSTKKFVTKIRFLSFV